MYYSSITNKLQQALEKEVINGSFLDQNISIRCHALPPGVAIGTPEHDDYPIIKGREVMIEAGFKNAKGQAFTDEFENADYRVEDLLNIQLDTNRNRAVFIAGLNAVFRYLELIDHSVHCRDTEPVKCAEKLLDHIAPGSHVLLVGFQPRFLEILASNYHIRAVDLDQDNINKIVFNIKIEPSRCTEDAIKWCDMIFATGSTIVNGTIAKFLETEKPVIFYGVTIAAAAKILNLKTYCEYGH